MRQTKLSVIFGLALLCGVNVCLGQKDAAVTEPAKVEPAAKGEVVEADSKAATGGPDLGSEASSDFDIEQLLKLIDALKNQDFDEVDKALKEKNALKEDSEDIKKEEVDSKVSEKEKTSSSEKTEKKVTDKKKNTDKKIEFEDEFESEKVDL